MRRLMVLGALAVGEHQVAEGLDVGDRDREEPGRVLGPADPEELDEGHDVLAVGPLGVLRLAAGDPALEDLGDRGVEAPTWASTAGVCRPTRIGGSPARSRPRPAPARSFVFVSSMNPVLRRPDLESSSGTPLLFSASHGGR